METIYFTNMQTEFGNSLEQKFRKLLKKSAYFDGITQGQLVALKVHVGERGNLGYVNPNFARIAAEEVKARGAKPFLTDTNTLYSGGRHNGVDHCITAIQHGYSYATVGAPFVPADGIRGLGHREVGVSGKHFQKTKLASGVLEAERIIFLTHFKGHIETGFGGSLKNLSMGCASVAGKMEQHAAAKPVMKEVHCVGCRQCYRVCPVRAVSMVKGKALIDYDVCIGCGQCVAACNYEAITPGSSADTEDFIEKVAEYAYSAYNYFGSNALYINFAMNITPDCDCWPANDVPVVEDVGILAGSNPFALDRATIDLINTARAQVSSRYHAKIVGERDVFEEVWDNPMAAAVFDHARRQFGVSLEYELRELG